MATFQEFARVAMTTIDDKTSRRRLDEILKVLHDAKAYSDMSPQKAVRILEELGPTYVKLGQLMSDRTDVIPEKYCHAFATLRDDSSSLPFDTVLSVLSESFSPAPVDEVFSHIEPNPLGSASIAQVHKAYLLDGTPVALKVRRPGIKETMEQDIELMRHLLAVAQLMSRKHVHEIQTASGFVEEIGKTTAQETDFVHEMENLERFYPEARAIPGIASPKGYPELSSESVLVMEYVEGQELAKMYKQQKQHADKRGREANPSTQVTSPKNVNPASGSTPPREYDLDDIAMRIAKSYISQFIDYGFFTSDPHMGNIIIRDSHRGRSNIGGDGAEVEGDGSKPIAKAAGEVEVMGRGIATEISLGTSSSAGSSEPSCEIVWIDMGMMGTLSPTERQLVSQVFLSIARDDAFLLKKSMETLTTKGGIGGHGSPDRDAIQRALEVPFGEPVRHQRG